MNVKRINGCKLSDRRKAMGWPKPELAGRIGMSGVSIDHLESGKWTPSSKTLAKMFQVLQLDESVLVMMACSEPSQKTVDLFAELSVREWGRNDLVRSKAFIPRRTAS